MGLIMNLSTRAKLFLGFGLMFFLLAGVIGTAYWGMTALKESQEATLESQRSLYQKDFSDATDLLDLTSNINSVRAALLTMMSMTGRADQERWHRDVKEATQNADENLQRLRGRAQGDSTAHDSLRDLDALFTAYKQTRDTQVIPLIYAGNIGAAKQISLGIQATRYAQMRSLATNLGQQAKDRAQSAVAESERRAKESEARADRAIRIFAIFGVTALLLGLLMPGFLSRIIADPLREISGAAEKIAAGDLTAAVSSNHRRDEVGVLTEAFTRMSRSLQGMAGVAEQIADGDLRVQVKPQSERDILGNAFARMTRSLQEVAGVAEQIAVGDLSAMVKPQSEKDQLGNAFARMVQSLKGMAGIAEQMADGDLRVVVKPQSQKDLLGNAFAAMVTNLQRMTTDVTEAVNVLGTSASEISASTTQLAASSTQTATAVNETTTTVEEIRQTAQVSTQKARYVAESAQRVVQISQSGKKSTDDTAAGMQRIREQMESIAESMVRLSEQSQAIGAIIATVDDLSQQSNLLAVNAAIEAAKAGEQGKGFAVVAQEVKSLADQSKLATTQVRTILSDIQKATGAAVMATELGSKAVEAGVQQSAQAGESIVTLADSVGEASQAATQIAASSQQQLVGMDQVVQAMESVKQASQQNVDGARQLETAARNLNELGQRLRQQVGQYKV